MHTVVIGSGIAGLAAALRMRAAGEHVTVLERSASLGGKLHTVVQDGYTFDAGPSFLTQPHRLDELFALFGEDRGEHLMIEEVDPSVHYHWSDGTRVSTPRDREALLAELSKLGSTPEQIGAYLDEAAAQYHRVAVPFVESDVMRARFWLSPINLVRLAGSLGMLGRTFHTWNQSWFPDTPRLVQLFCRYATYAGSDPYKTPAFMSSIADVELRQGVYYPEGGLRSVANSLIDLARRHGIVFRTECEVDGLERSGPQIIGVRIGNELVAADRVISAIDPQHLAPMLGRSRSTAPRSLSALIWFLGVDAIDGVGLHNILFSDDYRQEFDELRAGTLSTDPTVYLNCSVVKTPSHAPRGKQNWFVMLNAPADSGQDWKALEARLRPIMLAKLERSFGPIRLNTVAHYSPLDIARTSGAWKGSIYGPASDGMLRLFDKQQARDTELENLFYCGGSSHPGGGIPMCLSSAQIAAGYALNGRGAPATLPAG